MATGIGNVRGLTPITGPLATPYALSTEQAMLMALWGVSRFGVYSPAAYSVLGRPAYRSVAARLAEPVNRRNPVVLRAASARPSMTAHQSALLSRSAAVLDASQPIVRDSFVTVSQVFDSVNKVAGAIHAGKGQGLTRQARVPVSLHAGKAHLDLLVPHTALAAGVHSDQLAMVAPVIGAHVAPAEREALLMLQTQVEQGASVVQNILENPGASGSVAKTLFGVNAVAENIVATIAPKTTTPIDLATASEATIQTVAAVLEAYAAARQIMAFVAKTNEAAWFAGINEAPKTVAELRSAFKVLGLGTAFDKEFAGAEITQISTQDFTAFVARNLVGEQANVLDNVYGTIIERTTAAVDIETQGAAIAPLGHRPAVDDRDMSSRVAKELSLDGIPRVSKAAGANEHSGSSPF